LITVKVKKGYKEDRDRHVGVVQRGEKTLKGFRVMGR
jgi:hypothetical protein